MKYDLVVSNRDERLKLISVLSQIRNRTNQEIRGRCKMVYEIGIMSQPKAKVVSDCRKLQYELEHDYPFIHSLSDKDRESASIEESQEKINNALNTVFSFNAPVRQGKSLSMLNPMFKLFLAQQRPPRHYMTRQEREENKRLKRGTK